MQLSPSIQEKLKKYINYIDEQADALIIKENPTKTEHILTSMVCLQEECWELCSEIRKFTKMSFNKKKVENFTQESLEEEIADIYIVLLVLCKQLWIENLDETILKKIEKNNKRGY